MKRVLSAFAVCMALCAAPALAAEADTAKPKKEAATKSGWSDPDGVKEHVAKHVKYPATKGDLVKACNSMADVPDTDKQKFAKKLPDKTYKSADEVMAALGEK
jgi:uncharacterized protein YfaP (DUF2135 family)